MLESGVAVRGDHQQVGTDLGCRLGDGLGGASLADHGLGLETCRVGLLHQVRELLVGAPAHFALQGGEVDGAELAVGVVDLDHVKEDQAGAALPGEGLGVRDGLAGVDGEVHGDKDAADAGELRGLLGFIDERGIGAPEFNHHVPGFGRFDFHGVSGSGGSPPPSACWSWPATENPPMYRVVRPGLTRAVARRSQPGLRGARGYGGRGPLPPFGQAISPGGRGRAAGGC